jgi:hypothetical protein
MSPVLRKQVSRVGRRLFLQTLLDCLAWCWIVALALSVCWFLVQPYLVATPPEWLRWTIAGSLVGFATLVGVVCRRSAAVAPGNRLALDGASASRSASPRR